MLQLSDSGWADLCWLRIQPIIFRNMVLRVVMLSNLMKLQIRISLVKLMIQNITLEQKSALSRIMKVIWKHKNSVLCFRALQNNKVKWWGEKCLFPLYYNQFAEKNRENCSPKKPHQIHKTMVTFRRNWWSLFVPTHPCDRQKRAPKQRPHGVGASAQTFDVVLLPTWHTFSSSYKPMLRTRQIIYLGKN